MKSVFIPNDKFVMKRRMRNPAPKNPMNQQISYRHLRRSSHGEVDLKASGDSGPGGAREMPSTNRPTCLA
ncbi:MAG TPA: hypothetical protein VE242_15340 [Chthoniobacterales bacterium]|nr:hypothetical protein [Chthoniobacterales bacterium]